MKATLATYADWKLLRVAKDEAPHQVLAVSTSPSFFQSELSIREVFGYMSHHLLPIGFATTSHSNTSHRQWVMLAVGDAVRTTARLE